MRMFFHGEAGKGRGQLRSTTNGPTVAQATSFYEKDASAKKFKSSTLKVPTCSDFNAESATFLETHRNAGSVREDRRPATTPAGPRADGCHVENNL